MTQPLAADVADFILSIAVGEFTQANRRRAWALLGKYAPEIRQPGSDTAHVEAVTP